MRGNLLSRRFYVADPLLATYSHPAFACPTYRMLCGAMPALILPLIDAATHWPARGALVGLDLGTKTIGVAVSDPDRRLATGVETIARKTFTADAARLLAIATERSAAGFVLGLPLNMDGSEGPRAQSTRAFARNLSRLTDLTIALWDERLSTVAVERELIGMDMSRARRAKVIDEHAAIFILQGALDRLAVLGRS
jgi:putative Holliday junction resolvase